MEEKAAFTQPWDFSDVIFIVEGKEIHANKAILSMWSPVMRTMFNADFKEKKQDKIPLPGKNYTDFLELVYVLHQPNKDIDGKSA